MNSYHLLLSSELVFGELNSKKFIPLTKMKPPNIIYQLTWSHKDLE